MRIAIFVHGFFPAHFYGTETYTLNLAKQLQNAGHEPIVISANYQGEPMSEEAISTYVYEEIPVYCIDKNYFPNTRLRDIYYQPQMSKIFKDLLEHIKPDLVHVTHIFNHTVILLETVAKHNIPIVGTLTDFFGFCFKSTLEAADGSLCQGPDEHKANCLTCLMRSKGNNQQEQSVIRRIIAKYPWLLLRNIILLEYVNRITGLYKNTVMNIQDIKDRSEIMLKYYSLYDAVIAPTKFLRKAYITNGLKVPVHLIYFGTDLPRIPKNFPSTKYPIRFGFIGQISSHKGTDILVDAFCRLPKGLAELHIYGQMDKNNTYSEKLLSSSKGNDIFFKGTFPSNQIAEVLNTLDFLVIPSRWHENSPLVLLNALASHTPVIVSEGKGMTEFIEEGKNGYVFPMGSVDRLEKVLRKIIDNPESSREMFKTTEYPRTNEMMVNDVLSVYESVMSRR